MRREAMKLLLACLMMMVSISAGNAFAAGQEISVAVKGMVCGFCAQGIEKKFKAEDSVDKVDVSLKYKQVKLTLNDGKDLSDETIKEILTDSGYNVEKVERD
jgi:periplasmic mercuric ion binding protein